MVFLVDNLDVEDDILWEWIVELDIDLARLVQLGRFVEGVHRVSFVDVRDQFEHHGGRLHVSFLLVCENHLACHALRNPALKLNREILSGSWFNLDLVGFDREVGAAFQLDPVADWVLGRVAQLNILRYHVSEHCWELDLSLWNVVGQSLVELDAEKKKLSGAWVDDVLWSQVCLQTNLMNCLNDSPGIVENLLLVLDAGLHVVEGLCVAVVRLDQSSEHKSVLQVCIKVCDHLGVHLVHLGVVESQPLQQDGLGHAVDVAFRHVGFYLGVAWRHAWEVLERLGGHAVQVVDFENLIEDSEPGLHGEVGPHSFKSLGLHILFLVIHF